MFKSKVKGEELMRIGVVGSVVGGVVGSEGVMGLSSIAFAVGLTDTALKPVKQGKIKSFWLKR